MKKLYLLFVLCIGLTSARAQFVYQLKADSVRIHNEACKAELIIENSTKHINGFLYNRGNGRTEFRKALITLNDSTYLIGGDTLKVKAATSANVTLPAVSKSVSIVSPLSSENLTLFYTDRPITITKVVESAAGSSPSVTYNLRYASARNASGTAVFAVDRTVTSNSGTVVTAFEAAAIPAGSYVWLTTSAASGVINDFSITLIHN